MVDSRGAERPELDRGSDLPRPREWCPSGRLLVPDGPRRGRTGRRDSTLDGSALGFERRPPGS